MKDGTKEDYLLLSKHENKFIESTADRIIKFMSELTKTLEGYKINRLEHSLQTATRALKDKADDEMIVAALLHDIGDELAHYADACYDIEYKYPWGFDELEGVASRTDYDLKKHAEHSGAKLSYFDQQKPDPETGKNGWRYTPYVIEPAAGATRGLLVYLLDAYHEENVTNSDGSESSRVVMKFHPKIAPIKTAVLPLVKKEGLPEIARDIVTKFFKAGINARYDEQHSIGKRYRRHDEAGTPYCITIDGQTKEDGTVTIRDRDLMKQERLNAENVVEIIQKKLSLS